MDIYEKKTQERLALIDDMMSEAEKYNQLEADELKADINDFSTEDSQYYAIDRLIDINQKSAKIDYFLSKAKSLGWADQYAADGKMFSKGGNVQENQAIASEILRQIGGMNRLKLMTGAYNFIALDRGVSFRIKNPRANYIKIKLNSLDLYDLEVGRIRGDKYTIVDEQFGIYFDMLKPAIEKATGLYLSLFGNGGMTNTGGTTEQNDIVNAGRKSYRLRINYNKPLDSINISVTESNSYSQMGNDSYSWNIERMPLAVISRLYSMLDKVVSAYVYKDPILEQSQSISVDGKIYKLRVSYSREYNSTNINVVDYTGYPWNIERMPIEVINKLYSMMDKLISNYIYRVNFAADGAEIDAMVNDWKAVKGVLSKNTGLPSELRVLDIESNSVHSPVFIDFNDNYVIMENKEFGRTRNTLDKVKLFFEGSSIEIPKPQATAILTPAEAMKQKMPGVMPSAMPTAMPSGVAQPYSAPIRQQQEMPSFMPPKKQAPVTRVDPTIKPSIAAKVLQEIWAEAKGPGIDLISPEYMKQVENAIFAGEPNTDYESMIRNIMDWLDDNDIILRSKPFMKKVRAAIDNK